jgi:hypothetical protein
MAPVSLSFPSTLQGATSPPQTVTLTSSGAAALHISSVLLTGANANDFAMNSACSGPYPANASCPITVTFSPLGDGARAASITIADDAPGSMQMVPLTGSSTGAPVPRPAATITPPAVVFAAIPLGTTSPGAKRGDRKLWRRRVAHFFRADERRELRRFQLKEWLHSRRIRRKHCVHHWDYVHALRNRHARGHSHHHG